MSTHTRPPFAPALPENAPFSPEQRAWLNGFFAGLLTGDGGAPGVTALTTAEAGALLPAAGDPLADGDDGEAPWHDPAMPMGERMELAEGRPLRRRMMAAMAQQDCGQCGYTCEAYSDALFTKDEARLNLCVPGGKETNRKLKALAEELTGPSGDALGAPAVVAPAAPDAAGPVGTRERPSLATFLSRRRLNATASEKETHHIEFDLTGSGLAYEPGDSFGLFAENASALARAMARRLGLPLDEAITAGGRTRCGNSQPRRGHWLQAPLLVEAILVVPLEYRGAIDHARPAYVEGLAAVLRRQLVVAAAGGLNAPALGR